MRADLSAAKVKGKRKVKWTGFNSGVIKLFLEVNFTIKAKIGPAEAHFLCGMKKPPSSCRLVTLT